ncbi:metal-dependent transcriptional regulator [Amycolatopsis minnesotensis]|uniref:Metal-dependent transcriptional regulator n=1 Tax=Amycolatopsis minnesotensis TaxID=337894 RepID=A0ABN2S2A4_9PSEU
MTAKGLIDTTEMYLKAAYELEEDGVVPRRARLADRFGHSAPTVSQTVAKLHRDGLVTVLEDGRLELSARGRRQAVKVVRKHRIAEVLLYRVIGLDWSQLHVEACRWEHVVSDHAERRIAELCGWPGECPHGNPIPGLGTAPGDTRTVLSAVADGWHDGVLHRVSERGQDDVVFLRALHAAGVLPGTRITLAARPGSAFELGGGEGAVTVDRRQAELLVLRG